MHALPQPQLLLNRWKTRQSQQQVRWPQGSSYQQQSMLVAQRGPKILCQFGCGHNSQLAQFGATPASILRAYERKAAYFAEVVQQEQLSVQVQALMEVEVVLQLLDLALLLPGWQVVLVLSSKHSQQQHCVASRQSKRCPQHHQLGLLLVEPWQ